MRRNRVYFFLMGTAPTAIGKSLTGMAVPPVDRREDRASHGRVDGPWVAESRSCDS